MFLSQVHEEKIVLKGIKNASCCFDIDRLSLFRKHVQIKLYYNCK